MSALSRPALVGSFLIASGALFVLSTVLPLLGVNLPLTVFLAYVALVVALVVLSVAARSITARVFFGVAAIGFALVLVNLLAWGALGEVLPFTTVAAALAFVVGAVAILVREKARRAASVALVIAALFVGLYFVATFGGFLAGFMTLAAGLALATSGALIARKARR